jgi:hypothetical protein
MVSERCSCQDSSPCPRGGGGRDDAGEGTELDVFSVYRELLGPAVPLRSLERFEFYVACREPDLTVCATALHCRWRQAGMGSLPHGSR